MNGVVVIPQPVRKMDPEMLALNLQILGCAAVLIAIFALFVWLKIRHDEREMEREKRRRERRERRQK